MATFSKFAGLHTSHNYVSSVPEGALSVADNCVITSMNTVEPRRGQYPLDYTFGDSNSRANALFAYGTTLIAQYGTSLTRDTGSAFTDYTGTFTPVDDALCRMRGIEAAQNLYVNTATGVKVLDSAAGDFTDAGVPQCFDVYEVGGTRSASGYLDHDQAAAYRAVIGQKDANGIWHYGAPSQRTVVTNVASDVAIGNIGRAANVVTVNLTYGDFAVKYLTVGDSIVMTSAGEANFANGTKTVTAINIENNTFTYSEAGANAASTAIQTFRIDNRSSTVSVGLPPGVTSSDVVQLFRTEVAATATTDPGDEVYQVAEVNPPDDITVSVGGVVKTAITGSVTVSYNSHPYAVGQVVELSPGEGGASDLYSGPKIVTAVSANTFTYVDANVSGGYTSLASQTFRALSVVIDDNTPESFLGDPLYTNQNTGDGIEASSYEPPIGKDLTRFGRRLITLNTTDKHTFDLQLLGLPSTGATGRLTFTVDGTDYAFTATGNVLTRPEDGTYFRYDLYTTAKNLELTCLELVHCINASAEATPFYAVYMSSADDVPGKIQIREKAIGGSPIYVTVAAADSDIWTPLLPSSGETVFSTNDENPAGVAWSDTWDIESFPAGNKLTVGDRDDPIYRGIGLRDSLFVFKRQGGVYVIPNQLPFRPRELDPTVRLRAPDTVVTLNNQIYALTDQGLVTVTEAGVDVVGWPLDYDMRNLLNTASSAILRTSFSVSYESERQLWLFLPAADDDTAAQQAYIYNHASRAFTRAPIARTCGLVLPRTDIFYMGSADEPTLIRERKSFDTSDYADGTASVTVSAGSGVTYTLSSTADVSVGDVLTDVTGALVAVVEAVNGNDVTVTNDAGWTIPSTLTVYQGYLVELATIPHSLGAPGTSKAIPSAVYTFRNLQAAQMKATIITDEEPAPAEYTFEEGNSWGVTEYGSQPWGDLTSPNRHVAFGAHGATAVFGLKIRQAWAKWRLLAISAQMDGQSERGR